MTQYTQDQLDMVAEQMFDFACANRTDNLNRDGSPGNPRKVSCKYQDLWDTYRPATKKQRDKLDRCWKKNPPFSKFIFPVIKNMPSTSLMDELVSVQPMMNPPSKDL